MAPIGTVLKNGIIFAVISAPILYLAAMQVARGLIDILYTFGLGGDYREGGDYINAGYWNAGILSIFLSMLLAITVIGIVYMKLLSDTIEEGMVEF